MRQGPPLRGPSGFRAQPLHGSPARGTGQRPTRLAVVALACALAPAVPPACAAGAGFDAAPFGHLVRSADGRELTVEWTRPRDLVRVVAEWDGTAGTPAPDGVELRYWQSVWPEARLPRDPEAAAEVSGWTDTGDWFQGRWVKPAATLERDGERWSWTFGPIGRDEWPGAGPLEVDHRQTLRLRLSGEQPLAALERIAAYTDSVEQATDVVVAWAGAADHGGVARAGEVRVHNGRLLELAPHPSAPAAALEATGAHGFRWRDGPHPGALRMRVRWARPRAAFSGDRTVVTVDTGRAAFSFAPADLEGDGPVLVADLGLMATTAQRFRGWDQARRDVGAGAGGDVWNRVAAAPEQSLQGAWRSMPDKAHHEAVLGFAGARQRFWLNPDGSVRLVAGWIRKIPGADTPHLGWRGGPLRLDLGLPAGPPRRRELLDGDLPVVVTEWERDGVVYEQTAFATPLAGLPGPAAEVAGDAPMVLGARIRMRPAAGAAPVTASLELMVRVEADASAGVPFGQVDRLRREGAWIVAGDGPSPAPRLRVDDGGRGRWSSDGLRLAWEAELVPGAGATVDLWVPFVVPEGEAGRQRLDSLEFAPRLEELRRWWRQRIDRGERITTPEPMLDGFHRALLAHLLINAEREVGSHRVMARVGSFHYGVYTNEAVMMLVELDRRGLHDLARRGYQSWLDYQGTVLLPGDFASAEGQLHGAGGYESGGYNQHHGWALWGLAEHARLTGDRRWLEAVADGVVAGCDWIVRERARTADLEGARAIGRGLLPAGMLEDVTDWWPWLATNAYSWRGLHHAAEVLAGIDHPQAARLQREADDYARTLVRAVRRWTLEAPVVRLSDGTWVPHVPSGPHLRGRAPGWIAETLEGAIHLLCSGLIAPDDPLAEWILRDYEDVRYVTAPWGYDLRGSGFESSWFDRGGVSRQANLLCSARPYLLRGEIRHYLRAFFNAFAANFFADTRMMTEHAIPWFGDWAGDHYKTSDEANASGRLRAMFVHERGDELWLGAALPRAWMAGDAPLGIARSVTHWGPVSLTYRPQPARGQIELLVEPPPRPVPGGLVAVFRTPGGEPLQAVSVDGSPLPAGSEMAAGRVRLPAAAGGPLRVVARYVPAAAVPR